MKSPNGVHIDALEILGQKASQETVVQLTEYIVGLQLDAYNEGAERLLALMKEQEVGK